MDYTELLKELQEYFADLLIIQYRGAKKNRDLIKLLVNLIFANNLALQIKDLTVNVEESIGAQLDVVGKWVGVDRYYSGELWTHPYLAYPFYSTIQNSTYSEWQGGFSSYSTFGNNDGGFLTYKTWQDIRTTVNKIGDEYFRALIKLKIIKNSINHTCKKIDDAIWNWSDGNVYTTWGKEVFNINKFTVVGSPTITDDGIASGFTTNNYITVPISGYSNTQHVEMYIKAYWDGTTPTANASVIASLAPGFPSVALNTSNQWRLSLTAADYAASVNAQVGWTYFKIEQVDGVVKCYYSYDGVTYTQVNITGGTVSPATVSSTSVVIGQLKIYSLDRPYTVGLIDLKQFSIVIDGQEVFSGTEADPMSVTYHYTSLYKDLMTLANYKKILPVPTGCTLILEEITND